MKIEDEIRITSFQKVLGCNHAKMTHTCPLCPMLNLEYFKNILRKSSKMFKFFIILLC
jgi:hypothetical protein